MTSRSGGKPDKPENDNSSVKTVDPVSTEEDLEAADTLLSLGEVRDDTLDDDKNSQLMPIGELIILWM